MTYKLYIGNNTFIHHKNKLGLELMISHGYFEKCSNVDESDIILYASASPYNSNSIHEINIYDEKYKNKMILLGPHFSVFPTNFHKTIDNNINQNIRYNSLSKWVVDCWKLDLCSSNPSLPIVQLPFPVDVDRFKPDENIREKNIVIIYIKNRVKEDYEFIIDYMKSKNYQVIIFNYKAKYNEIDFLNSLKMCKFCIWIGCHESQGFALQETLSCDVPLLVFNVTHMGQEEGYEKNFDYCRTKATCLSYWHDKCGEVFYEKEDFEKTLNKFLINFELNKYKPRDFVLENLSTNAIFQKFWKPVIEDIVTH